MTFVIVGTYGQKLGHVDGRAPGVYVMKLNADGSLTHVPGADGEVAQLRHSAEDELCRKNPTYLAHYRNADGSDSVYVASEGIDTVGSVLAAKFDRETGHLELQSQSDAGGRATCHVVVPASGNHVFAANYLGTICAFPRNDDGSLGERSDLVRFPLPQHELLFQPFPRKNKARQDDTHPHMVSLNRDHTKVLVPDLGLDVVWNVDYAAAAQADDCLSVSAPPAARTELVQGGGPRHIVLHPTLNVAYVLYEMASIVVAFPTSPDGVPLDVPMSRPVPTLNEESGVFEGTHYGDDSRSTGAAIRVHPSGKFLYTTNRVTHGDLDGLVSCFALEGGTGIPTLVGVVRTGGKVPRDMQLTPDGKLCLVANQNSDNISSFSVDTETGELSLLHTTDPTVLSPVCVLLI